MQIALSMDYACNNDLFFFNFIDDAIAICEKFPQRWILEFRDFTP